MSRIGSIFVVLMAMVFVMGVNCQDEEEQCGPNQTWNGCGSGCGEFTCVRPRPPGGVFCPAVCVPGCYCNRGWTRRESGGPCVRRC